MHRILSILIAFLILGIVTTLTYTPLKREVFYHLGFAQDATAACCNVEDILSSTGSFDESAQVAVFNGDIVDYPKTSLAQLSAPPTSPAVLGTTTADGKEKWIEVSLEQQKLRAWEGETIVMEYPISSGKWFTTPKGTFHIWYKTRNQRMKGGSKDLGTYYDLPNVPHNMFYDRGFGIHGAYWHNNFGTPMSHGCINEPLNYAEQLFNWAGPVVPEGANVVRASDSNPGTKVFIH